MKNIIQKALDKVAFKFGYINKKYQTINYTAGPDLYNKNNLLDRFYSVLKSISFFPKHIVDVGANHGTWTRETLIHFPDCRYTMIEPQAHMQASVSDLLQVNTNVSFYGMGAGKQKGIFNFTIVNRDDSCSFRYSEAEATENNYRQIQIPVVTLNEFVVEYSLPVPDIIKIDAEGLDLEVLEGANHFFGVTEIFMIEAGVVNKQFPNSFLNLINYMDNNNYRLFDITDLNRPFNKPVLWLTEIVFVKKNGFIDSYNWLQN